MKRLVASGASVLAISGLVTAAMLHTNMVCGCEPEGYAIIGALGVNPMKDDPARARNAFLVKVPKGSPYASFQDFLGSFGHHCKEAAGGRLVACVFDMEESTFGAYRKGFKFDVTLDSQRRVDDVAFEVYKRPI